MCEQLAQSHYVKVEWLGSPCHLAAAWESYNLVDIPVCQEPIREEDEK